VAFDNASSDAGGDDTLCSWSHDPTTGDTSNLLAIVCAGTDDGSDVHASTVPTYAGANMTLLGNVQDGGGTPRTFCYYLIITSVDSETVTVTFASQNKNVCSVATFTGVDTSTPIENNTTNTANLDSANAVTNGGAGDMTFDATASTGSGTMTVRTGGNAGEQTRQSSAEMGGSSSTDHFLVTGTSNTNTDSNDHNWNGENGKDYTTVETSINAFVAAGATLVMQTNSGVY